MLALQTTLQEAKRTASEELTEVQGALDRTLSQATQRQVSMVSLQDDVEKLQESRQTLAQRDKEVEALRARAGHPYPRRPVPAVPLVDRKC